MNFKNISKILLVSASVFMLVSFDSAFASKRSADALGETTDDIKQVSKKQHAQEFPTQKELVAQLQNLVQAHGHLAQPLDEYGPMLSRAINFFKGKIGATDDLQKILNEMEKEAGALTEKKALTLDHLNFYTLKLMVISKPDFKFKFDFFKNLALFRDLGDELKDVYPELTGDMLHPWEQTYQTNLATNTIVKERLEAAEAQLSQYEVEADSETEQILRKARKGLKHNTQFRYNFLEVSKRGMSVVPFFQERPIYSLENYIELFIQGIYLAGASTTDVCSVHEDLIDDPASVYYHDILHLQGLAPSTDAAANKAHMDKMREVACVLWTNVKKFDKKTAEYKQGRNALFALLHELSQYKKSNLLKAEMTTQEAFNFIMQNARANVKATFLSDTVIDRESYYDAMINHHISFDHQPELKNQPRKITDIKEAAEDGASNNAFFVTFTIGDVGDAPEHGYSSSNHLLKYENARKFAYQIAWLLKNADLCPTLTLENFTLGFGHQKFNELLNWFEGTYGPVFGEASVVATETVG